MTLYLFDNQNNQLYSVVPYSMFKLPLPEAVEGEEPPTPTFVSPAQDGWTNGDYYLQEVDDTPGPVVPTIEELRVTMEVSRLQAKAVLYQHGLLTQIEGMMAQADFLTQMAWNEAQVFRRLSPIILMLQSALTWPDESPITDEDLDNLFLEAAAINF